MFRFFFEDNLEPVEWYDHPNNKLGPYKSIREAIYDLEAYGFSDPSDVCYVLMTEDQAAQLRANLTPL